MIPEPSEKQTNILKSVNSLTLLMTIITTILAVQGIITGDLETAAIATLTLAIVWPITVVTSVSIGFIRHLEKLEEDNPLMDMAENMADMFEAGEEELEPEDFKEEHEEE